MRLLYERDLLPQLAKTDAEVIDFARILIDSNNARNWQMASELSFLLRRNNRHEAAVEVSRMLFEKDPTVDKLNLYFVAVVDEGSFDRIRHLHEMVDQFVQNLPPLQKYQKHLYATWLKAANRIQDDDMFQYVYSNIPSSEKTQNSYIISQYYVYLNRHGSYKEVMEHYEKLPPNMQNSKYVRRYYQNASSRMGYSRDNPGPYMDYESEYPPDYSLEYQKFPPENGGTVSGGKEKRVFLVYGSTPPILSVIKSLLQSWQIEFVDIADSPSGTTILEKFEGFASKSAFAIVLLTPADKVYENGNSDKFVFHARQNVIFEWGYFLASVGKENVMVLAEYGANGESAFKAPSDIFGTEITATTSGNWLQKLSQRLKASGFNNVPNL